MDHKMNAPSWIEHDSNGRAYFVRKKPVLPSFRQIFAEAFRDIRSNYSTANEPAQATPSTQQPAQGEATVSTQHNARDTSTTVRSRASLKKSKTFVSQARRQQQQRPAMARDNNTPSRQSTPDQPQPAYIQHQLPLYTFPFPPSFHGFPQQGHHQDNTKHDDPPQTNLGTLTHYSFPHPRMYPFVPPGMQPAPSQPMMPTPTPGAVVGQVGHLSEPPTSQSFMPGFPPNVNPMTSVQPQMYGTPIAQSSSKLRCGECGRERSSKYQWKHRNSSRRKAEPNICRRCRKSGTESEYESDDSEYQRYQQRRSRSRRHSGGRTSRARSSARSPSRPIRRGDFDFYAYQDVSESGSDYEDYGGYERKRRRGIRRRNRSVSADSEPVRGSRVRRSISRPRRVVYVEPPRSHSDFHSSDENIEIRYVDHHSSGPLVISKPPTPTARAHSDFPTAGDRGTSIVIERREYYDDPHSSRHLTRSPSRLGARKSYPHSPITDIRNETHRNEVHAVEGGSSCYEIGMDGTPRDYRLRDNSRNRSRSHYSIDEGAESGLRDRLLRRASSPSSLRQRSHTNSRSDSSKVGSDGGVRGRRRSHSRTSSRRRRRSEERNGSQRGGWPPADDYDWYDKDGMRIRVREI